MGALQIIRDAGFNVLLDGDALAIRPASALTQEQRDFLKQHKAEIVYELRAEIVPLSHTNKEKLLAYMDAIGETDPEIIAEVLDECASNPDKLNWLLHWADKQLSSKPTVEIPDNRRFCAECRHLRKDYCIRQQFRPLDDIPRRCVDYSRRYT